MKLYFMGLTDHMLTLGIPPNLICGTDTEKGDKISHPNIYLLVCSSIMVPPIMLLEPFVCHVERKKMLASKKHHNNHSQWRDHEEWAFPEKSTYRAKAGRNMSPLQNSRINSKKIRLFSLVTKLKVTMQFSF